MSKASAPRPVEGGREAKAEEVDQARTIYDVMVRGVSVGRLAPANVPLAEKMEVRRQVRVAWHDVLGMGGAGPDVTTYAVMAWLARRASGEPLLSWIDFQAEWDDTARLDEMALAPVDDGADDPQP
jgi:hypothetical protein